MVNNFDEIFKTAFAQTSSVRLSGVSQSAAYLQYLQYLQRPQSNGQPQAPADNDGDADDVAGAAGGDSDHDRGHVVDVKA